MIDNWDFNQSDGRPNIMEGSGYGGGNPWARLDWRERLKFLATLAGCIAFLVGSLWVIWLITKIV